MHLVGTHGGGPELTHLDTCIECTQQWFSRKRSKLQYSAVRAALHKSQGILGMSVDRVEELLARKYMEEQRSQLQKKYTTSKDQLLALLKAKVMGDLGVLDADDFVPLIQLAYRTLEQERKKLHQEAEQTRRANEIALKNKNNEVEQRARTLEEELEKNILDLVNEREQFEWEKAVMQQFQEQSRSIIKLDVGGVIFKTSVATLTKANDSMLAAMFSGRYPLATDDAGAIFIDRDPTHFRIILNFLLDGYLPPDLSSNTVVALQHEAEYYQLPALSRLLAEPPYTKQ